MNVENILTATPAARAAFLLPAPGREVIPTLTQDPEITDLYAQLVALHYAAFVAVWGPAPVDVHLEAVQITQPGGLSYSTYLARLPTFPSHSAVDWLQAFEAGLDSWAEAEMANPLTMIPAVDDANAVEVSIAAYEDVVVGACRRLKRVGRTASLRHLREHLGEAFPARFDPDHPDYSRRT